MATLWGNVQVICGSFMEPPADGIVTLSQIWLLGRVKVTGIKGVDLKNIPISVS